MTANSLCIHNNTTPCRGLKILSLKSRLDGRKKWFCHRRLVWELIHLVESFRDHGAFCVQKLSISTLPSDSALLLERFRG